MKWTWRDFARVTKFYSFADLLTPENCLHQHFMLLKSPTVFCKNPKVGWLNCIILHIRKRHFIFKMNRTFLPFLLRVPFNITLGTGVIKLNTTFVEERLGLMHKRPSYRLIGTHPSPRSVLEWRSANRSTSLSLTSRLTLCTHWSLMGNTAPAHWVVTRGRRWLVLRPHCSSTVARKVSILWVPIAVSPEQE